MPKKSTTTPSDSAADIEESTPVAPTGSLATPRENVHAFTPLSAKYRLNLRGPRADAPDYSTRAFPSHYAKGQP